MIVFVSCLKAEIPIVFVYGELYWWERVICYLMGVEVVYLDCLL